MPKAAIAPIFVVWLGDRHHLQGADRLCHRVLPDRDRHRRRPALRRSPRPSIWRAPWARTPFRCSGTSAFPNALPAIFGGLKVASTLAVVGAIVGEFVSADSGLGYLVLVANGELNTRLVFACVLMLTRARHGLLLPGGGAREVVVRWHVSARQIDWPARPGRLGGIEAWRMGLDTGIWETTMTTLSPNSEILAPRVPDAGRRRSAPRSPPDRGSARCRAGQDQFSARLDRLWPPRAVLCRRSTRASTASATST